MYTIEQRVKVQQAEQMGELRRQVALLALLERWKIQLQHSRELLAASQSRRERRALCLAFRCLLAYSDRKRLGRLKTRASVRWREAQVKAMALEELRVYARRRQDNAVDKRVAREFAGRRLRLSTLRLWRMQATLGAFERRVQKRSAAHMLRICLLAWHATWQATSLEAAAHRRKHLMSRGFAGLSWLWLSAQAAEVMAASVLRRTELRALLGWHELVARRKMMEDKARARSEALLVAVAWLEWRALAARRQGAHGAFLTNTLRSRGSLNGVTLHHTLRQADVDLTERKPPLPPRQGSRPPTTSCSVSENSVLDPPGHPHTSQTMNLY